MAAIPTILKGDDSGTIEVVMAAGHSYTGATLVLAYQGVTRKFTNLAPGMHITFSFTHAETSGFALGGHPMLMRLIGAQGAEETIENAEARIKVTDCMAEVSAGGSFIVRPASGSVPVTDVGDVPSRYTLAEIQAKVNEIVRVLAQRSLLALAVAVCAPFFAVADVEVQTARLDSLYNDSLVVTNVTGGGGGGGVETNAVKDIIDAEVGGTNTLVHAGAIADMETQTHASQTYQPIGNYLTEHQSLAFSNDYRRAGVAIPATDISDAPWITEHQSLAPATNYVDTVAAECVKTNGAQTIIGSLEVYGLEPGYDAIYGGVKLKSGGLSAAAEIKGDIYGSVQIEGQDGAWLTLKSSWSEMSYLNRPHINFQTLEYTHELHSHASGDIAVTDDLTNLVAKTEADSTSVFSTNILALADAATATKITQTDSTAWTTAANSVVGRVKALEDSVGAANMLLESALNPAATLSASSGGVGNPD